MAHLRQTTQSLRFQRKQGSSAPLVPQKDYRPTALLKEYTRLHQKQPWTPAFSAAVRLLLIIRISSAMYSIIQDCDETYNYWEPLHSIVFPASGGGSKGSFQTWEYAPDFAIRSWAYLAQYWPFAASLARLGMGKRQVFFAVRILLAFTSTVIEARFYRTVVECVNLRVGRYLLSMMVFSAGMFEASTALLPSTFSMYATMLAMSFALHPSRLPVGHPSTVTAPSQRPFLPYRVLATTFFFALGAVVGWPFSLVLAVPFVIEELFLKGDDLVPANRQSSWLSARWTGLFNAAFISSVVIAPVFVIDTLAYGRSVLVPLNIIKYNVLSASRGAGPELYGVESPTFYLSNLTLNFNILLPLALLSLPALLLTARFDPKRIERAVSERADAKGHKTAPEPSSPFVLMLLRLTPFYLWLAVLTLQPHKEERFMYPAYPLLCLNAAVAVYLLRGLFEAAFISYTKSPYKASKTSLFRNFTTGLVLTSMLLGVLRIVSTLSNYHAPMDVLFHLEGTELPRVVATLFPETLSDDVRARIQAGLPAVASAEERDDAERGHGTVEGRSRDLSIDLSPLKRVQPPIRLCYAKEWHRFPTHFLVPDGVEVEFVRSEFKGILPRHFEGSPAARVEGEDVIAQGLDTSLGWLVWPWQGFTRNRNLRFNDLNLEMEDVYVPIESCDYLVDLSLPNRPGSSLPPLEPDHASNEELFERLKCVPFLDNASSRSSGQPKTILDKAVDTLLRSFWLPDPLGFRSQRMKGWFGEYCLLKKKEADVFRTMKREV
ncbi:hypothetical protein IE53DRAFT_389894 [Violaceomyces palustris]|uniref:Uncharacterized protein n=1 Tax=Violaceomyces palustris TaxID=1673888 RepID=A0ACD0NQ65_9BASI|nr:hypothetical protein IE53DRAFT_389894 [Violaceomyces palustris]